MKTIYFWTLLTLGIASSGCSPFDSLPENGCPEDSYVPETHSAADRCFFRQESPLSSPGGSEGASVFVYSDAENRVILIEGMWFASTGRWAMLIDQRKDTNHIIRVSWSFYGTQSGIIDPTQPDPPYVASTFELDREKCTLMHMGSDTSRLREDQFQVNELEDASAWSKKIREIDSAANITVCSD